MKFKNVKIIPDKSPFIDADLYLNHTGDWLSNVTTGSRFKKETGLLEMVYTITFHTQDKRLIQKFECIYQCKIELEMQSVADEKIDLWQHIRKGLIFAINVASGNDKLLQNKLWQYVTDNQTIEKAYNALSL